MPVARGRDVADDRVSAGLAGRGERSVVLFAAADLELPIDVFDVEVVEDGAAVVEHDVEGLVGRDAETSTFGAASSAPVSCVPASCRLKLGLAICQRCPRLCVSIWCDFGN
jgi:hypothetical protein